jgi:CRP-like cAMP-binding protein/SAM-dependent methyltransferase
MFEALVMLGEFDESDVQWLLDTGAERQAHSGETIIREGAHPPAIYFVLEGLLGVTVSSAGDKQLAVLGPGELMGEISFLEDQPATATVAAVESSVLLAVPRTTLEEKIRSDAAFAARFFRSLALISSRRLRERVTSLAAQLRAKELGTKATTDRLAEIERIIDGFKEKLEKADGEAIKRGGQIPQALALQIDRDFQALIEGMNREIGLSSSLDRHVKEEFGAHLKTELLPYLLLTQTAERFYSKPRGYAGDFFTIEKIYQKKPAGSGRLGPLLDECFLNGAPARAVRNRRGLLVEEIRRTVAETSGGEVRVASLACGPAREVFDVFETLEDADRLRVTLLDIDSEALAFVAERAKRSEYPHRINTVSANLVYLALGRQRLELPPQHLVYSIGLIDYFNDRLVGRLIDYIYGLLEPGGRVILGNFHPDNSGKAFMDYILDWKLIHRTEDDMNRLFAASRFGRCCTRIQFEQESINLFAECVKQSPE